MNIKRLLTTAAFSLLVVVAASAQDEFVRNGELKSWSFVEAQGGAQMLNMCYSKSKLMTPTAALSFGHYFTPAVGLRLHANGWQSKAGLRYLNETYKWKYFTGDLDVLLNVTNLFSKKPNHPVNVILLGGLGVNRAWDNNDLKDLMATYPSLQLPLAWNKNRLSHNLRAGLRLETDVTKIAGISLEINGNSLDDRFSSIVDNQDDWQWTAMLGLSVRFGKKYASHFVKRTIEVIDSIEVDEPYTFTVKEQRKKEEIKHMSIEKAIFFKIRKSDASVAAGIDEAIKEVADLMKTSDDATFTVTGYADKGTGNPRINKKYAKQRAESVKNILINDHGIAADRMVVDSKGDTVQPFPEENDKNRCVIITGEGNFKVTTYEDVDVEKQATRKVKKAVTRQESMEVEIKH